MMTPIKTDQNAVRGKHDDLTERVIKVYYDVYNEPGYGFLESVYHEAMRHAPSDAGLRVETQIPIQVHFRNFVVGIFKAALVVNGSVLIELKTCEALLRQHESQTLNYLRATKLGVALLMNFGPEPRFKRLSMDNEGKKSVQSLCIGVKSFANGGKEWV